MSNSHRGAVGAAFALAVVLAVSSAAWACTVWRAKLSVWGVSAGSSGTVSAVGSGDGMTYCGGALPTGQANVGSAGSPTRDIMLSVAVDNCSKSVGLPNGLYTVNYLADKSADCMDVAPIGQFTLTGGATPAGGVGPFTIPEFGSDPNGGVVSTRLGGWADICINSVQTIDGNQVPIFLLG